MFDLHSQSDALATSSTDDLQRSPAIHHFNSTSEWLRYWVEYQIAKHRGTSTSATVQVPSGEALYLYGSIGLDTAITPDGEIWIDTSSESVSLWRVATSLERTSILVSAQRLRFPELIVLLPLKPANATECPQCNGTGHIYRNLVWCGACGSLGWTTTGCDH
jgi:hypothetical protein